MKRISAKQRIALIIFGFFLSIILLEAGLRLGEIVFFSLQEHRNRFSIKQKSACSILCLGESTTAMGGKNSYPCRLEKILNQRNTGIKFTVINKGVPGVNTEAMLAQLEHNLNKYSPDIVTAMIGINDRWVEKNNLKHKAISDKKTVLFLNSLKICKLLKLLRLHIASKTGKIRGPKIKEKDENISFEINPENDEPYLELGERLMHQGKSRKAEEIFKKALEMHPENDKIYFELGRCYKNQTEFAQAEGILKKAIAAIPKNDLAYFELGWCYSDQEKYGKAIEMFKKAIAINPENSQAYFKLGYCYAEQEKYDKAKEMFKKAAAINPKNDKVYVELGLTYAVMGEHNKTEEMLKKAIEKNPKNRRAHLCLANAYKQWNRPKLAKTYFKKAKMLRKKTYNSRTVQNYQKIKEILTQREIKLVCIQYPMRSVVRLKRMLKPLKNTIFVDNERIFKEAVKKEGYGEYFTDIFAGDFGHCTPKGNRLLAENIAKVILKQYFNNSR